MMMLHQCAACVSYSCMIYCCYHPTSLEAPSQGNTHCLLLIYGGNDWVDCCTCIIPFNSVILILDFVRIGPSWLGYQLSNSSVCARPMIMLPTLLHSAVSLVPFTNLSVKFIDHGRCGDSRSNGTFTIVRVISWFLHCADVDTSPQKWEWEGLIDRCPNLGLGLAIAGF